MLEPKKQILFSKHAGQQGHILVALLVTIVITTIVGTALVGLVIVGAQNALGYEQTLQTQQAAESGVENAIRCVLRDPNYTGGTLQINNSTVTIDVMGSSSKSIEVKAQKNNLVRTVSVNLTRVDGMWEITSWEEVW